MTPTTLPNHAKPVSPDRVFGRDTDIRYLERIVRHQARRFATAAEPSGNFPQAFSHVELINTALNLRAAGAAISPG